MKEPFTLFKRGRIWYYKLEHENTRHSTGKTNKSQANHYVQSILQKAFTPPHQDTTVSEFTKKLFIPGQCKWIERKRQKGKEVTLTMAQMGRGHLDNHILPAFGSRKLSKLTTSHLDEWLLTLKRTNKTKNHILDTLKIIWSEAIRSGLIKEDITASIERFSKEQKDRDVFTEDELAKLFPQDTEALTHIWQDAKKAALFSTLCYTGIRSGEAYALTWGDWKQTKDGNSVLYITKALKNDGSIGSTKNGRDRFVFVTSNMEKILRIWQSQTPYGKESDLIFPNRGGGTLERSMVLRWFRTGLQRAQIKTDGRNLVIHSFRHTYNTIMRRNIDDNVLRQLTGHTSAKMTDHYDHPNLEDGVRFLEPQIEALENTWREIHTEHENAG